MTLKIEQLSKSFGEKKALDDLSMTVEPGQVMGLIGQNGAGKTTCFRMILDFIKADSGRISFQGKPIDQKAKQGIGFLPEERGLYQKLTVEEQLLYFAELHGMKRQDARSQLKDWFDRLQVVGKLTDKVQSLSKGNAQKVQFIATLLHEPDFLILDEPFTGLDPVNTQLLREEIKRASKRGAVIVFSNHNMSDVELLSDQLTMLKAGKTVLQGELQAIRDSYGKTRVYLESELADEALLAISGVESLAKQGPGRLAILSDESAGQEIFKQVTAKGYVQAFMQSAPTLDEIFRMEATQEHQEVKR
ncbi:ABC transporter ATP-binding protein [Lactococcus termiticola]|uniref:Sodium ABC transporter ATP-binding protein n=1 Tax=Lactococcus termiticola TaxID=2169526 RepID=A0A2R5HJD4_9LACT|nr:ABC transporter ATP-binding protein [Lactococcus termiticola]GBG96668.1 sodium ABC transporter ATP-binding protein [Lactococcus termiticola]